jgi:SAM-dependent methyltransferase
MTEQTSFDPIWESKYAGGHAQRYPWDAVVSFVFRNAPKDRPRESIRILEVGCGTGSNLWFAAREGFAVGGVDASVSAIAAARKRFEQDGLVGELKVANFNSLPFPEASFDLVIDRGSLTCVGRTVASQAIEEIKRVLVPGGRLYFNPYSDQHSSASSGRPGKDGLTIDIAEGTMVGVGQICFYGRADVLSALSNWHIHSVKHVIWKDELVPTGLIHAEWQVVAGRADA